jgi:hypothetical protein
MHRIKPLVLVLALWWPSPALLQASPLTRSAVMVYKSDRLIGSGVVVTYKGAPHVLTCAHVIDAFVENRMAEEIAPDGSTVVTFTRGYVKPKLLTRAGRVVSSRLGRVVKNAVGHKPDLALIRPDDDRGLVPVPLLPSPAKIGEPAWYCGAGNGNLFSLIKTIVNDTDDRGFLRVNGEGWYGHSGSGVLVKRRGKLHLAGVVWGVLNPRDAFKQPVCAENHKTLAEFLK